MQQCVFEAFIWDCFVLSPSPSYVWSSLPSSLHVCERECVCLRVSRCPTLDSITVPLCRHMQSLIELSKHHSNVHVHVHVQVRMVRFCFHPMRFQRRTIWHAMSFFIHAALSHSISLSVTMFQLLWNNFVFSGPTHTHRVTFGICVAVKSVRECRCVFIFLWRQACVCVCVCVCDLGVLQNAFKLASLTEDYFSIFTLYIIWCLLPLILWEYYRGHNFSQTLLCHLSPMTAHEHGCGIFTSDFFLWALTALVVSQLASVYMFHDSLVTWWCLAVEWTQCPCMLYYQCKLCVRSRGNCNAAWHDQSDYKQCVHTRGNCDAARHNQSTVIKIIYCLLETICLLFLVNALHFSSRKFMKSHVTRGNGWLDGWYNIGT